MGAVAGANEAEQTPQGAEQTPQTPEKAPEQVSETATEQQSEQTPQAPGFGERGRMRRRARFLRKARELAYRDLGGLVFDLHRFGQRNDPLVLAKLGTLKQIDTELRELEGALRDRRPVTVLREVGIAACPRCAAIHGSDDRFCPGCGLAFDAHADRPISTAPVNPPTTAPSPTFASTAAAQAPTTSPSRSSSAPLSGTTFAASTRAEPAPALKPTTSPVAAKPSFPLTSGPVSRPAPASPPASSPPASSPPASSPPASSQPAASQPTASEPSLPAPERKDDKAEEDEPTQILRPPASGA
jgi:hypothetical protein